VKAYVEAFFDRRSPGEGDSTDVKPHTYFFRLPEKRKKNLLGSIKSYSNFAAQ
jgi:hypothetical protein